MSAPNASTAVVELLRALVVRDLSRLPALSDAVRTRGRVLIGRSPEEINPARPDLARAVDIAPGWMIGLNISNRDKMMIIRAAAEVYGLSMPDQVSVQMPNA